MTIGPVLMVVGVAQTVWMICRIRTYEPGRIGAIEATLNDIGRTKPRPKSKFGMTIERYSYWYGLLMGLVILGFGLIFTFTE